MEIGGIDKLQLPTQAHFLYAVSFLNPEVLQSLRKLCESSPPDTSALMKWSRRWNLACDWMVEWARHTINWQRTGPSGHWGQFYHPRWSLRSRYERAPETINESIHRRLREVNFGGWIGDPTTKSAVRKEIVGKVQQIIDDSFDQTESDVRNAGLFENSRRRGRGRTKISKAPERTRNEIFLWLAGYQTCGWSRGQLAEAVGVERNAVGMGIKKLADQLGLNLRSGRIYDKTQTKQLIAHRLEQARAHERSSEELLSKDA